MSDPFGPKVAEECRLWSSAFALDPPIVESAFTGYVSMLADAGEASDGEIARSLSKLRRDIQNIIAGDSEISAHAEVLDEMVQRLDRSLDRTTLLEHSGLGEGIGALRARLTAARALVGAVRAAFARRGRRSK